MEEGRRERIRIDSQMYILRTLDQCMRALPAASVISLYTEIEPESILLSSF